MNIRIRIVSFLLFCLILIVASPGYLQGAPYDLKRTIPVRFTYQGADTLGWAKDTGWKPLIPFVVDFKGYLSMGNVPLKVSVPAMLVMECTANQIYAGNQVPCRAWIESSDDPDVKELSSNYGFSLGIKFQDWWSETELANIGKDFAFKMEDHGRMPLGSEYLCAMDTIEFASFPIDWLIPGSGSTAKAVKGIFSSIGDSGVDLNMASMNIAGELVVEGNHVRLAIGNSDIELSGFRDPVAWPTLTESKDPVTLAITGFNDPNVKPFALTIPSERTLYNDSNYYQGSNSMFYEPMIQYSMNLYNSAGFQFTLVPPLSFSIMSSAVDKGKNIMNYACPDSSTLKNGSYYNLIADDFKISSDLNTTVSFPLTDAPDLPDLAVTEILINDEPKGKVFVNEWTGFKFKITNIGNRDTQGLSATPPTPEPLFSWSLWVDGQKARDIFGEEITFRKLDDDWIDRWENPAIVIKKNESYTIMGFQHKFTTEGPHTLTISTGYNEYKTTENGQPVYGIGDYNVANNYLVTFPLYVQAPRGMVLGVIETNPCGGDCGVNGVRVCLREAAGGSYNECQTTALYQSELGPRNGVYRFEKVPTGDYYLEYLPTKPTPAQIAAGYPDAAYWAPRSFYFHHEGQNTDDFNYSANGKSGMRIYQYQNLKGYVKGSGGTALSGVTVRFGDVGPSATTDASGLFVFNDVPPFQQVTLNLSHPAHKTKKIVFGLSIVDSSRRETTISGDGGWSPSYWDSDLGNTGGPIAMAADATAPTLYVEPLASQGFAGNTFTFRLRSSDGDKETYQYRYLIYDGGTPVKTGDWTVYTMPADPAGLFEGAADWTGTILTDKAYSLVIEVQDGAGNKTATEKIPFTKDTMAPVISSVVLKNPVTGIDTVTYSKEVDVQITISNPETGTLAAQLSNDGGATWSDPFSFTGASTTIRQWRVTELDNYSGPKTVHVRVTDLAGNAGATSDSINVDTTGSVYLAWAARYYNNTHVPLSIDIVPPDGSNVYPGENGTTGGFLLGTTSNQYRAQTIIPASPLTFNKIALSYSRTGSPPKPFTGDPGPLHVKIVSALDPGDPTCAGCTTLFNWSADRDEILSLSQKATTGGLPIYSSQMVTLNQGTPYYLLVYTEGASDTDYYMLYANDYGVASMPSYIYASGWQPAPSQGMMMQNPHLSFQLWNNDPGQIRIAEGGNCGALTDQDWQTYLYPALIPYRFVDLAGVDGWKTVCVDYRNLSYPSKDRSYYASVFLDTALPTATADTVKLVKVDPKARKLYFDIAADDASGSGVEWIYWTVPGYERPAVPYQNSLILDASTLPAFSAVEFTFRDRAGNESAPISVPLKPEDDFLEPTLNVTINDGSSSGFTQSPTNNHFHFSAGDNVALAKIVVKETLTGKTSDVAVSGTSANVETPVVLPAVKIFGVDPSDGTAVKIDVADPFDGVYEYSAYTVDAAGNRSKAVHASITLDRKAPSLGGLYLTGIDGRPTAISPNMFMGFEAKDEIGPMTMRYRINGSAWSAYQAVASGQNRLSITGSVPLPQNYQVDVELKDGAGNMTSSSATIRTNRQPATPVGGSPSGTSFTASPRITPSPFYDADGDALAASWFIVRKTDDQTVIVNTLPLYGSSGHTLSSLDLSYDVGYTWSARYLDSFGQWSSWSTPVPFILRKPTLTVNKTGNGRIMSGGGQIDCGADCSEIYDPGYSLVLTATPDTGYVFEGWSGACAETANCRVVMDADKTVTASFAQAAPPLPGDLDGSGKVDLADAVVALRVLAGFHPTPVTLSTDVNVDGKIGLPEALYVLQALSGLRETSIPALMVVKSGNGTGTVSSSPGGIACGDDCSETYAGGATVTLTAVADSSSSTFAGWSGACTGAGGCSVPVYTIKIVGAAFSLQTWTITASAGTGGAIAPVSDVTVDHGSGLTFTITPAAGYHVADVLVDSVSVGAVTSYSFTNVTAAGHTIAASFAPNATTFTITASAGANGTISPSGPTTVNQGAGQTFTITPATGGHVADVIVDNVSVGAVTSYPFTNVTADHTITASFAQNTFTITASAGANGTISPSGTTTVNQGAGQTFTITPATGYHVADVLVDGASVGAVTSYPFANVTTSHTIAASFTPNITPFTLTASSGTNGTIAPIGTTTVSQGAGQVFTITPGAGYHVADVLVDGVSVGPVASYTFTNVTANHTIAASFAADVYFAPADLAGAWRLNGITTGVLGTAPYGTMVLGAEGQLTEGEGSLTYPDALAQKAGEGQIVIDALGVITGQSLLFEGLELAIVDGKMASSKTLMTFLDQHGDGSRDLMAAVKEGGTFAMTDLSGSWRLFGFRSGEISAGPLTGSLDLDESGQVLTGSLTYPGEKPTSIARGSVEMDSSGALTAGGFDVLEKEILTILSGKMDPAKAILAFTDQGKFFRDLFLAVKVGGTFTTPRLSGTWHINGMDMAGTLKGIVSLGEAGNVRGGFIDNGSGPVAVTAGSIAMDAGGVIRESTISLGGTSLTIETGKMTPDGDVIVWTAAPSALPENRGFMVLIRSLEEAMR